MMHLDIYQSTMTTVSRSAGQARVARMSSVAAPDGGFWGWMAVFACFMGNLIGDGVMYSFGVFLPKFKEYFNCGSGETSTINALQMGVTFASGYPPVFTITEKAPTEIRTPTQKSLGNSRLVSIVSYSQPSFMIIASVSHFTSTYRGVNLCLA